MTYYPKFVNRETKLRDQHFRSPSNRSPKNTTDMAVDVRPKWIHIRSLQSVASNHLSWITGPKASALPPRHSNLRIHVSRPKALLDTIPRIYFTTGLQALNMDRSQPGDHTGRKRISLKLWRPKVLAYLTPESPWKYLNYSILSDCKRGTENG